MNLRLWFSGLAPSNRLQTYVDLNRDRSLILVLAKEAWKAGSISSSAISENANFDPPVRLTIVPQHISSLPSCSITTAYLYSLVPIRRTQKPSPHVRAAVVVGTLRTIGACCTCSPSAPAFHSPHQTVAQRLLQLRHPDQVMFGLCMAPPLPLPRGDGWAPDEYNARSYM